MLPAEAGLRDYFPCTDFLDRTTWESGNLVRVALRRSSPQIFPFQPRSEARAAWLQALRAGTLRIPARDLLRAPRDVLDASTDHALSHAVQSLAIFDV